MKAAPKGWPRVSSSLFYSDPRAAIDWLCNVFDFELRLLVDAPDGGVEHSELVYGDGVIMVSGLKPDRYKHWATPDGVNGKNTQCLFVYVDDVEAHARKAREGGAVILSEPVTHDYGEEYWADRTYECRDPGGHHWWFAQRLRSHEAAQ